MKDKKPTHPADNGGPRPGGTVVEACAANCPTDFKLDAPCRIIKAGGGRVTLTADDLPTFPTGTYTWRTTSNKIRLLNTTGGSLTVEGLANPSAARDAETITVTRTATGCAPVTKTVTVTVAKVTFSQAANQRYGYDDFDTPADPLDDHISIKKSDHSFVHVVIEGGAVASDFDFVCDTPATCLPAIPGGGAVFDLRLNGGAVQKAETPLHAKVKCPSAQSFAQIQVHVYAEVLVEVVVAKIHDSTVAATALNFATADYSAHTAAVNDVTKAAVVRYDITNYDAANAMTNVRYDLDNNGVVTFDIAAADSGPELVAISAAMTGTGTKTRIAIVKDMKSYYYLSVAAAIGDTTLTVRGTSVFFTAGDAIPIGSGAGAENGVAASIAGNVITLTAPLTKAHAINTTLEFPAAGWSTSPILIIEGSSSVDIVKWTVPHEAGHHALGYSDIVDRNDIMNFSQDWTDHRLRYCPRTLKYDPGTENQWDFVTRPAP